MKGLKEMIIMKIMRGWINERIERNQNYENYEMLDKNESNERNYERNL